MTNFENDNSEKYIPEKDVKETILIKILRPENLAPVKNWTITLRCLINGEGGRWGVKINGEVGDLC